MINAYAPVFDHLGFCVHSRKFFQAMNRLTPVCLVPLYPNFANFRVEEDIAVMIQRQREIDLNAPAICLAYGNEMHRFTGSYRIGYTVFEYTRLPGDWVQLLKQMDEVWVPSRWGKEVLCDNGLTANKVVVIPEGVDPDIFFPDRQENFKQEPFTFLSVGKWEMRKGQDLLLRAWAEVFGDRKDVQLVVSWPEYFQKGFSLKREIEKLGIKGLKSLTQVQVLPSEQHMAALYRRADCFVLPTRGEGWGLPVIEAMACGLPVITTGYGGVTEYADAENAYLLSVQGLTSVYDPIHFPVAGEFGQWADINIEQLKELLWHVFTHQEEAANKGQAASSDVHNNWTWIAAAQKAVARLESIGILV